MHPISALQTEYSLFTTDVEAEILPTLRELGIGFVAYSPLGRGMLTGKLKSVGDLAEDDTRSKRFPRFSDANFQRNVALVAKVEETARSKDCTSGQIALAWVLGQGDDVVPIPGTKRRTYLEENLAAAELRLTADELQWLAANVGRAVGDRYADMATVNR